MVVVEKKAYVYALHTLALLRSLETPDNAKVRAILPPLRGEWILLISRSQPAILPQLQQCAVWRVSIPDTSETVHEPWPAVFPSLSVAGCCE